ncbi:hypothetical protein [Spiroplasma poulsonii]|uniref:hypothetical protein n=1 Tax=Spiroplasma poulsonii TaxID=2138 RepID=UPI001F4C577F|nr:hypothetical protein [Spiroplasma poulsonii]UNF62059.1 hypothetical protein MNU24_00920 [Spiroplasma poulsonii]
MKAKEIQTTVTKVKLDATRYEIFCNNRSYFNDRGLMEVRRKPNSSMVRAALIIMWPKSWYLSFRVAQQQLFSSIILMLVKF